MLLMEIQISVVIMENGMKNFQQTTTKTTVSYDAVTPNLAM